MTAGAPARRWGRGLLGRLEEAALVGLTLGLLGLAFGQILLRNLFGVTFLWAEPLSRHLVLWAGLLGALTAAGCGRHIRIDAALRLLPARGRRLAEAAGDLSAAAICLLLCYQAARFVLGEASYGERAFLGVPRWALVLPFPVAFGGMGLRFAGRGLAALARRRADGGRPCRP